MLIWENSLLSVSEMYSVMQKLFLYSQILSVFVVLNLHCPNSTVDRLEFMKSLLASGI